MKISKVKRFVKSYNKLNIIIQNRFDEKLKIFSKNPLDNTLRNHSLNGDINDIEV